MPILKGSETCLNLMRSFAGEAQARARYDLFADIALEEGYKQLENIFKETANNELAHAKIFFDFLYNGLGNASVPVNAEYPVEIGTTHDNLFGAAAGEHDEHINVYPHFAEIAAAEGFKDISFHFKLIAEIEGEHEERFKKFGDELANGSLFKKEHEVYYKCIHCGHVHSGPVCPTACPNCHYPQSYFMVVPTPSA